MVRPILRGIKDATEIGDGGSGCIGDGGSNGIDPYTTFDPYSSIGDGGTQV